MMPVRMENDQILLSQHYPPFVSSAAGPAARFYLPTANSIALLIA